jgi:GWxTD domain-containing protein
MLVKTRCPLKTAAKFTAFILSTLLLAACNNSYINEIDRTGLYDYRPGYPELNIVTAGTVDEYTDSTFLNISAEVMYSSLIFKNADSGLTANVVFEIQILNETDPTQINEVIEHPVEIVVESAAVVQSDRAVLYEIDIPAMPGEYEVNVSVIDLNSNKQTLRTATAYIPDINDEVSHITNIRVLGKADNGGPHQPITTYNLATDLDSVRFVFQVTNTKADKALSIRSRLLKFESDTSAARPMSWPNYSPSNISYIGIRYSKYEEIASQLRTINRPGNVSIEYNFSGLERGNYRFEVFIDEDSDEELYRAREFSVKSANYPFIRTPRELAAPLVYLMNEKEYEKLMDISNPSELKYEIDKFWLNNLNNKRIAQSVIELYYERVEQANKQFTNYKEGWKTDQGFIYILFGPPMYVTRSLNEIVWSYSHNLYDPETNFVFHNPKMKSKYYPFENFILQRNSGYFSIHYQQIQQWLNGTILRDNL